MRYTSPALDVYALCVGCTRTVRSWRGSVSSGALVLTERGELAVRALAPGACDACGSGVMEIRVESRKRARR